MKKLLSMLLAVCVVCTAMVPMTVCAESDEVVLEFWDMPWGGSDYNEEVKAMLDEYTELTGVKFNYTSLSWQDWLQVFLTAVSSGNGPDVSTGGSLLGHRLALMDGVYDVTDIVDSYDDDYFSPASAKEAFRCGDITVGIPWNMDCRMMIYNKELFEADGVEIPTTWDEFYDACVKLTHDDQYGYATTGSVNFTYWEFLWWSVNNGGHYLNDDLQAEMNNEENVEAGEFLRKLYKEGLMPEGVPGYTDADKESLFMNGKVAMMIDGPSIIAQLEEAGMADKVGVLPTLTSPNGYQMSAGSYNALFIYEACEHKEEATEFVKWYLDNYTRLWSEGGCGAFPTVTKSQNDEYFSSHELYQEMLENTIPTTVLQGYPYENYTVEMDLMDSEYFYQDVLQKIYMSDDDVADILAEADELYNEGLEDMKE